MVYFPSANQRLDSLHAQGFDQSATHFGRPNLLAVKCSQCAALVINGTPTHEAGCPNQTYECKGCNASVSRRGAYCADCL